MSDLLNGWPEDGESGLCLHGRVIGHVCMECESGAAEEKKMDGLCKPEPEIRAYLERLNEDKMTTCVGNSMERSMCFLHDEPCSHRGCEIDNYCEREMGKKDPQMLAEYWMEKFLDAEKAAKAYREAYSESRAIIAEYHDLLRGLSDLFEGKTGGGCVSDAPEEEGGT